jgi:predicted ATPase
MVTIRTPDQRLRVFVSSTLGELAVERRAVRAAIESLRLTPVMFELGARPHPPRDLYRAYLQQSDIFVGLYWQRYGWVAPDMEISGLEDEYLLCGDTPRLLYIKGPAPDREPGLAALLARMERESLGSYRRFADVDELTDLVRDDLAVLLSERFLEAPAPATATIDVTDTADPPPTVTARLPVPATSLVGREGDVDRVADLLTRDGVRLVTLTGPGGIGKSRLAVAVADRIADRYPGGTAFVPLASVRDPGQVLPTIATTVGASLSRGRPPLDALAAHFDRRPTLLVLDNLEQVVDAGPGLVALLAAAEHVDVLATSRRLLRLSPEHEYPVPALGALPEGEGAWLEQLADAPAVRLFVARARAVRGDFELTETNALAVAEICRRLDGIPLAIELAAARVRLLPPPALLTRLTNRLDGLGRGPADLPERQRTLRDTIRWSLELLEPESARRLESLAVFSDGWTLEAAAAVWDVDELEALELLDELAGHSLVQRDPTAREPRFRLLETVRELAASLLADRDDAHEIAERHTTHFLELAEQASGPLRGVGQPEWVARLTAEHGNLRVLFDRLLEQERLAELAVTFRHLFLYLWLGEHLTQLRPVIEAARARLDVVEGSARVELLWGAAALLMELGDDERSLADVQAAHAEVVGLDEPFLEAIVLLVEGFCLPGVGDHAGGRALLLEALDAFRAQDELFLTGLAAAGSADFALVAGDIATARALHEEAFAIGERIGSDRLLAQAGCELGLLAVLEGRPDEGRALLGQAVARFEAMESAEGLSLGLYGYAWLATHERDPERAVAALGAAAHLLRGAGLERWGVFREAQAELAARLRDELGGEAFETAWRRGSSAPWREALAAASAGPPLAAGSPGAVAG